MSLVTASLHPGAKKVLSDGASEKMQMMAARGMLPGVPPHHLVTVIVGLATEGEGKVRETATVTLGKLPPPVLKGALSSDELQEPVVEALASRYGNVPEYLPLILRQPAMTEDVLKTLAAKATEQVGEIIGTNEALILKFPGAIEKLYMNKQVRMSTADRLIDLAVRNGLELDFPAFKQAAAAIQDQLIAEPTDEPTFQDKLFLEAEEAAAELELEEDEDVVELDEEGKETVQKKALPLFALIQNASITEKIRMAMLGKAAARLVLVRDANRLVSEAAARSPMLTENEGAQIAAMRSVSEDVLRIIAMNREMVRSYTVKVNLVNNPRTPFTFASRLLPYLRQNDMKAVSRSKNVPGAVQKAAKAALERRR